MATVNASVVESQSQGHFGTCRRGKSGRQGAQLSVTSLAAPVIINIHCKHDQEVNCGGIGWQMAIRFQVDYKHRYDNGYNERSISRREGACNRSQTACLVMASRFPNGPFPRPLKQTLNGVLLVPYIVNKYARPEQRLS